MIRTELVIDPNARALLVEKLGTTIGAVAGEYMDSVDVAWSEVSIETSAGVLQLRLEMEVIDIDGLEDEFPTLNISAVSEISAVVARKGNLFYQFKGRTIREIVVVRDTVTGMRATQPDFSNTADIGILCLTDEGWISICRASHMMEVFRIHCGDSIAELNLPDTKDEWEETLVDHYTVTREFFSAIHDWQPIELS